MAGRRGTSDTKTTLFVSSMIRLRRKLRSIQVSQSRHLSLSITPNGYIFSRYKVSPLCTNEFRGGNEPITKKVANLGDVGTRTAPSETTLRTTLARRRYVRRAGRAASIVFLSLGIALYNSIHPLPWDITLSSLPWLLSAIASLTLATAVLYRIELGRDGVVYASRRAPWQTRRICNLDAVIEVRSSTGKGNGAFATARIEKGTFLGTYSGELLDNAKFYSRYPPGISYGDYVMKMDSMYVRDGRNQVLGETQRFATAIMNHSCDGEGANVLRVWRRRDREVLFYTARNIDVGEELCFNYGRAYWKGREERELP